MNTIIFTQLIMLLLMICLGFLTKKLNLFDEKGNKALCAISFNISLPLMVFCAISSTFTASMLQRMSVIFAIVMCTFLGSFLLSIVYVKLLKSKLKINNDEKGIHQYCFMFSNIAFVAIPLIKAFWGDEQVVYASVFIVGFSFFNNSVGIAVLSNNRDKGNWLGMFRAMPFWGAVLGIVFGLNNIRLSGAIFENMQMIGNMTTPLAMIFIGHTLASSGIANIGKYKRLFITSLFRLVILPGICYIVLRSIFSDYYIWAVSTLMFATPFAITMSIIAERQGSNVEIASYATLICTLCSMITIPLWAVILL